MTLPQTALAPPEWVAAQSLHEWLTERERLAGQAFASPQRRANWLAGRLAAKRLLLGEFGQAPLDCEIAMQGVAPTVHRLNTPGICLSLSHSHGLGAASWARETEGAVGIDAQWIRPVHPRLRDRALTESEQRQAREFETEAEGALLFWALKEAAIKARRLPWGRTLRAVVVSLKPRDHHSGCAEITLPGEPIQTATYARCGNWWLARAMRPPHEAADGKVGEAS